MRLESKAPVVVTHATGAFGTLALDGKSNGFVSDETSLCKARQPCFEAYQWCGQYRPVARWILTTYWEEGERHAWAGLCAECRDKWQAGVERRRAERRWRA